MSEPNAADRRPDHVADVILRGTIGAETETVAETDAALAKKPAATA